jgi:hypothetical protein
MIWIAEILFNILWEIIGYIGLGLAILFGSIFVIVVYIAIFVFKCLVANSDYMTCHDLTTFLLEILFD